jgi:pSer/pThr/pTyr-binding forkhead associated (FHA) protein
MPRVILSMQGAVIKEVVLSKEKTTLGRRPYNDIVLDNLAVSGEHACFIVAGSDVFLEDRDSTNGTYVNGRAIEKHRLNNGDQIEVGKFSIAFVADPITQPASGSSDAAQNPLPAARIRVMTGPGAGRELPLSKAVTTLGKPGVAVAAIHRKASGFEIVRVGVKGSPSINAVVMGTEPKALSDGDMIELAGSTMQFIQLDTTLNTGTI